MKREPEKKKNQGNWSFEIFSRSLSYFSFSPLSESLEQAKKYQAKLEFPGGGGGGAKQKPLDVQLRIQIHKGLLSWEVS